jgi:hypothetical protein
MFETNWRPIDSINLKNNTHLASYQYPVHIENRHSSISYSRSTPAFELFLL